MKFFLAIFLVAFLQSSNLFSQSKSDSLQVLLAHKTFSSYGDKEPQKRRFLSLKGKSFFAKINPLHYAAGGALFLYQRVVSDQISAECCYEISCSAYAKAGIEHFGFVKGILLGLNQFNCCVGGVSDDYPEYKVNSNLKVLNSFDFK